MQYLVEITETLTDTFKVTAKSEEDALMIVKEIYEDENIVLDHTNIIDVNFKVIKKNG